MKSLLPSRPHFQETFRLAIPLIISQVGHIVTGIVDNMFLGKFFGETEQAAGILSNQIFTLILVFLIGLSFVITPSVNEAFVRKDENEKTSLLKNSVLLLFVVSFTLFLILFFSSPLLQYLGQPSEVVIMAIPFYHLISLSIIPVSFFFVGKQFCEGQNNTKMAMFISISGNVMNILLNYFLITGFAFFPKMGYLGSCWATLISRIYMGIIFMIFIFYRARFADFKLFKKNKVSIKIIKKLFSEGLSYGAQLFFEVAAFAICGLMCGVFGKASIDAHGISMGIAAFTYMFSSGISGAATIRVSNYKVIGNSSGVREAGLSAFKISMITMLCFGLIFILFHQLIPQFFTSSFRVAEISSNLLIIAAIFQLFDGVQVTGLGVLRGIGDVKFATYTTFIVYWVIAIPLAWILGFYFKLQVYGIWLSLCVSLILVAVSLFFRFNYMCDITPKKSRVD